MTPSRRLAFSFLGACGERLEWTITATIKMAGPTAEPS